MRVQDVIRGEKSDVSIGDWGSGKFQKKKFPLSKAGRRAYALGSAWQWRFADFTCEGRRFVMRLVFNAGKAKASAHLAMRTDTDLIVLCCYEFHVDHQTGWHVHTLCGDRNDIDTAPAGSLVHGPWVKRLPASRERHRRTDFYRDMDGGIEAWLWREAMRFFGIEEKGSLV
jgi:hypothetical protein